MKPLLRYNDLSRRWYVLTRYTERDGFITASTKYDITDDMEFYREEFRKNALADMREQVAGLPLVDTWARPPEEPPDAIERAAVLALLGGEDAD